MTYQEQVMQIAQVLAGYSLAGADLLRRAMGKKIPAEMEAQRQLFFDGAAAHGVERARAELIFDQMAKFAGYGFNKPHAAAYALVTYQTAYLKANYPVEFLAALMTLDLGNTDKLNIFRQELSRLDIRLLPPDINRSEVTFSVEQDPTNLPSPASGGGWGGGQPRDPLCARRGEGSGSTGDGRTPRRADGAWPVQGFGRFFAAPRRQELQPPPVRKPRQGRRVRQPQSQSRADLCRGGPAVAPGEPRRRRTREPPGEPFRRHRSELCAAPVIAVGGRLATSRAPTTRILGDRIVSVEPSARPLRQKPRTRRDHPLDRPASRSRGQPNQPLPAGRQSSTALARSAPRAAATVSPLSRCRIRAAPTR